jgi:hypothetical protein
MNVEIETKAEQFPQKIQIPRNKKLVMLSHCENVRTSKFRQKINFLTNATFDYK